MKNQYLYVKQPKNSLLKMLFKIYWYLKSSFENRMK